MLSFQVIIYKRTPHGVNPRKDTNTQNAFFCQNMQNLYLLYKGIHYTAKAEKNEVSWICDPCSMHVVEGLSFLIFLFSFLNMPHPWCVCGGGTCTNTHMSTCEFCCLQSQKEGIKYPGPRIASNCDLTDVVLDITFCLLTRARHGFHCWDILTPKFSL